MKENIRPFEKKYGWQALISTRTPVCRTGFRHKLDVYYRRKSGSVGKGDLRLCGLQSLRGIVIRDSSTSSCSEIGRSRNRGYRDSCIIGTTKKKP